jgi:ERCC4-type nuclease
MTRRPPHIPDVLVVVDTREQAPLSFPLSRVAALRVGDYAPLGLEGVVAIERKSHSDLAACCGYGRDRFRKQFERLAALRYGALLVEPTIDEILMGMIVSKIHPRVIMNTVLSWSVELGVPVFFAGGRQNAAAIVLSICRHAVRHFGDPARAEREELLDAAYDAARGRIARGEVVQ